MVNSLHRTAGSYAPTAHTQRLSIRVNRVQALTNGCDQAATSYMSTSFAKEPHRDAGRAGKARFNSFHRTSAPCMCRRSGSADNSRPCRLRQRCVYSAIRLETPGIDCYPETENQLIFVINLRLLKKTTKLVVFLPTVVQPTDQPASGTGSLARSQAEGTQIVQALHNG